jgi:hypothetical protein
MSAVFRPVQDGDFVFRLLELSDYEKGEPPAQMPSR